MFNRKELSDDERSVLIAAAEALSHSEDAHWTKDGQPDLNVLTESCGFRVTREMADAVLGDMERGEGAVSELVPALRSVAGFLEQEITTDAPMHLKQLRSAVQFSLTQMGA